MLPTSAPPLLERPASGAGAAGRPGPPTGRVGLAIPVPRSAPAIDLDPDLEPAAVDAAPAGRRVPRLSRVRRLPLPPGRRAPLWFAALVAGALVAGAPAVVGGDAEQVTVTASDLGLGTAEHGFSGGIDEAGVRRGITEAEAQARLDELAASRAAREPKTVMPLSAYRLTTRFGMRWGEMHPGWDMAAPLGTPIYSATDGVVVRAGRASGFGYAVYIQDPEGNVHIYGHMRYYDVKAGDIVRAGDQIAKVGNEGFSTGPHVHWEIHRGGMDGRALDPQKWLTERDVSA